MIIPTVGRVVWFWPGEGEGIATISGSPLPGIVSAVWSDTCVNLSVFDANGESHSRTSVLLVQEGNERPTSRFCEWTPYQKGQAAKTEQLVAQLAIGTTQYVGDEK